MSVGARIQVRRDTAANWTAANPTLLAGERGFETDTGKEKVGTGAAAWTALPYTTEAAETSAVKLTGAQTVAGVKTFSASPIVPTPTEAGQAVTKAYADAIAANLSPKESVVLATAVALPANTYSGGVLTATGNGALTVDSSAVLVGQRIIVKNEATAANNGIYVVTAAGAGGAPYVLTRSADLNTNAQVKGSYAFVEAGTVNEGAGFTIVGVGPFIIGTTAITWTQFSGAGEITAGAGLTKTGNTLSVTSLDGGAAS